MRTLTRESQIKVTIKTVAIPSALLTVAEFSHLPQPLGGIRQELHHGELIKWAPVKTLHTKLQRRLLTLLESRLNPLTQAADKEFPFRPAPEYEVWIAEFAVFSRDSVGTIT